MTTYGYLWLFSNFQMLLYVFLVIVGYFILGFSFKQTLVCKIFKTLLKNNFILKITRKLC
jgi:hypothetical protein